MLREEEYRHLEERLISLEADRDELKKTLKEIQDDVKTVRDLLTQGKGIVNLFKAISAIVAVIGTIGGVIFGIIEFFKSFKH